MLRTAYVLLFFVLCITGCADVRQHWADGLGKFWIHSSGQVAKHGPEVAGDVAADAVENTVDGAIDDALFGHEKETPREWQERMIDGGFENN